MSCYRKFTRTQSERERERERLIEKKLKPDKFFMDKPSQNYETMYQYNMRLNF